MIFKILRTSIIYLSDTEDPWALEKIHDANKKPCEEAFLDRGCWYIRIDSLEELIAFSIKCECELVVNALCQFNDNETVELEIYDAFRE